MLAFIIPLLSMAQGWPANYQGVMLQGFYWDSYEDTKWTNLTAQADELSKYFDLIWVPNSGRTKNDYDVENGNINDMGYMPMFWFNHNSCFGTENELRTMINTFNAKNTGIIEDVVINHKNGQNSWCDFPEETWGDYTLTWSLADICYNDNGGATVKAGFNVTGAADTGDDFDGCRDLDHTSSHVQDNVKHYLRFLQNELGYIGYRYDMVKGYGAQYVGIYNKSAKPIFSVGEYWDNWDGVTAWVNGTTQNGAIQSAAFDFPLKFLINDAFNNGNWNALTTQGMAGADQYKRYSVTFVDNHDTYRDNNKMSNDKHVLAANAFILAMPGTPCIFLPHWQTHKESLKKMIAARKIAGINNQSIIEENVEKSGGRVFKVRGTNGSVLLIVGYVTDYNTSGYTAVVSGDNNNNNFCFYVNDGIYNQIINNNTVIENNIPKANAGLESVETNTINVYVDTETKGKYLYVWDDNETPLNEAWPGKALAETGVVCVNNKTWYVRRFNKDKINLRINWEAADGNWRSNIMTNITSDVFISYDGGDNTTLDNYTATYAGYPEGWFEEGEVCAFFEDDASWGDINAWAWNGSTNFTEGNWPGVACTKLGKNESGNPIWKWTYTGNETALPEYIIFNHNGDEKKTKNCVFTNGAWYKASANKNEDGGSTNPVSTGVSPTTEISLASIGGSDVTATNWNGNSEHLREATSSQTLSKTFRLAAGSYKVQAIVRGTADETVTLAANGVSDVVTLKGFDGTESTVSTNGIVEKSATGTNNGWHKAEITFTLGGAAQVEVSLTSTATQWQVGALKVLEASVATKASNSVQDVYFNATSIENFSFFERGANKNVLTNASSNQVASLLPYNVIVSGTCADLKLSDGSYDFGAPFNFTAGAVSYDRAFTADKKVTVCLPFAVSAEELANMNAKAYEFTGIVNGKVKFTEVNAMEANTPYVFVSTTSDNSPFASLSSRSIAATTLDAMEVPADNVTFTGTMTRQTLSSDAVTTYYGYSNNAFVKVGNNVGINPFRAYLKTSSSLGKSLQVVFDDTVDGINLTTDLTSKDDGSNVYDISGRLIQSNKVTKSQGNTLKKGLYIIREGNGANAKTRKIIIK